jgi:very-long-chain (3R)-3-hydroxyacyl-CoA dehydratase
MNIYLGAYNLVNWVGWTWVLVRTLMVVGTADQLQLYASIGWELALVQSLALLEVVHGLVGIVRTPVSTTIIQVSSRLLLVWGICYLFPSAAVSIGFVTMVLAWSVTECVRYMYYALNALTGTSPAWLTWCRYTFFYVLYPMGAGSEAFLIYRSLEAAKEAYPIYYVALLVILCTYPPGLYVMYTHMIKQRSKYQKSQQKSD